MTKAEQAAEAERMRKLAKALEKTTNDRNRSDFSDWARRP